MSCGIYKITNKINGHSYIGLSKNIESVFLIIKQKLLIVKEKMILIKFFTKQYVNMGLIILPMKLLKNAQKISLKNVKYTGLNIIILILIEKIIMKLLVEICQVRILFT